MASSSPSSQPSITVLYHQRHQPSSSSGSDTNSTEHTFSHSLAPLPSPSFSEADNSAHITQKTAYLSSLRSGVKEIQADINAFLTQKMEEDKASTTGAGKAAVEDEKEEEMYGEEDPEKDG